MAAKWARRFILLLFAYAPIVIILKFPPKNSVNITKNDDFVLSFQQDEVKECDTINAIPNSLVVC
jgi:hypothetical protein